MVFRLIQDFFLPISSFYLPHFPHFFPSFSFESKKITIFQRNIAFKKKKHHRLPINFASSGKVGGGINWNKIDLLGVIDDTMKLPDISDSSFEMELIPYPIFEFYAKENWNEFAANDTRRFWIYIYVFSRWKMKGERKREKVENDSLFLRKRRIILLRILEFLESQSDSWFCLILPQFFIVLFHHLLSKMWSDIFYKLSFFFRLKKLSIEIPNNLRYQEFLRIFCCIQKYFF